MKGIRSLILCGWLFACVPTGCSNRPVPFDRKGWDAWDGHYHARETMIDDVVNNRLKAGMTRREVVELLGEPNRPNGPEANDSLPVVRYEISVGYKFTDIDPCKGKDLFIRFGKDSTVVGFRVVEWRSGEE